MDTLTLGGRRFVIMPESEYPQMRDNSLTEEDAEPPLPEPNERGNYPAAETMRVLLARDIIRGRRAAGLTQAELARLAGIRPETLNRLEKGKHSPSVATIDKIDRALTKVGRHRRS